MIQVKLHKKNSRRKYLLILSLIPGIIGVYLLLLIFVPRLQPNLPNPQIEQIVNYVHSNSQVLPERLEQELTGNLLIIPKINVKVQINEGGESALEYGAWHRYPDQGNPLISGNFILTAHRFSLRLTPGGTINKSPFFNLHQLQPGDEIIIFWEGTPYRYLVDELFEVDPYATEIEDQTSEKILTLYSCTLKGKYDGRLVVRAVPLN